MIKIIKGPFAGGFGSPGGAIAIYTIRGEEMKRKKMIDQTFAHFSHFHISNCPTFAIPIQTSLIQLLQYLCLIFCSNQQ